MIDVRANVTVAEATTQARGLAVEGPVSSDAGIDTASVINCDGIHTIGQRRLTKHLGSVDEGTRDQVCGVLAIALGVTTAERTPVLSRSCGGAPLVPTGPGR